MANLITRFFAVDRMVRPEHIQGELPTTRDAYREVIGIAIPSVVEMVFMSVIGSIDVVMVGSLGYEAIAAVGLTGQPRMILLAMFFALNVGVTAIVARRKGQGLPEEANRTLRNALVIIMGMTALMMVPALLLSRPLMQLAGAQADTIDMATTYFQILAWFLPVNALTMCINAAQRGVGNTRITMYVNITANVVNVIFNYLLIGGNFGFPALGVAGAAYATGIGFSVGLVLCLISIFNTRYGDQFLRISLRDDWRLNKDTIKSILKVGGNAMIEQVAMRLGFFVYAIIVAGLGTQSFAAHQVAMQFLNFSFTFGDGLAVAGTSLVGQMLGRKRPDIAVIYGKCCQRLALAVSFLLAAIVVIFRYPLVSIFLDGADPINAVPFAIALNMMFMVALFQPVQTSSVVISGCLRGAGDNLYVALVMIICVVIIRPVLSVVAVYMLHMDLIGAWSASLIDMSVRLVLMYWRFTGGKWHNKRV